MKRNRKKKKTSTDVTVTDEPAIQTSKVSFTDFSIEIISAIFNHLSPQQLLQIEHLSRKIHYAVLVSLRFREELDFEDGIWDVKKFTGLSLMCLSEKMPSLKFMYNIGSLGKNRFTMKRLLDSLRCFQRLEGVTVKSVSVLNSILLKLPAVKVLGCFSNQERSFPPLRTNLVDLPNLCNLTKVHLVGCCVKSLPQFGKQMKHLYFRLVEFTDPAPFFDFYAPTGLECFVMSYCIGPMNGLPYLNILDALDGCKLSRFELQRVPLAAGMIQAACSNGWEAGGFCMIQDLTIGECRRLDERDIGFLIIASLEKLRTLRIQPSLSSNVLFGSLATAELPEQRSSLHHLSLGWEDTFPDKEIVDSMLSNPFIPSSKESVGTITDQGMQLAARCFPYLEVLEINKCPYLTHPLSWHTEGENNFECLTDLTLKNCPNLSIKPILNFLCSLPYLQSLVLENMFSEPPVGCSRVGIRTSMDKIGLFEKFPEQINNLELIDDGHINLQGSGTNTQNAPVSTNTRRKSLVRNQQVVDKSKESKKEKQQPKCTCVVKRKDSECHVDETMLTQFRKQMKKARIKMHNQNMGTLVSGRKKEKVIKPRPFIPHKEPREENKRTRKRANSKSKTENETTSTSKKARKECEIHHSLEDRPATRDQCDSTNDPVLDQRNDAFVRFGMLTHKTLKYIYLNNVGFTQFELYCPKLKTIHMSRCKVLWRADMFGSPALTNVHVSQCSDFNDEPFLLNSIYGVYPNTDKFVSLRPMHKFDVRSFMNQISSDVVGTVLVLDYSSIPSETSYNKHRAKSWIPLLRELTSEACDEFFLDYYADNYPGLGKHEFTLTGKSENGSKWKVITDIPLLKIMADCPDIEIPSWSCDPNTRKAGVYCPEAKGHRSLSDTFKAFRSYVEDKRPSHIDLYEYTVVTYVNMCDVDGKPANDPIPVL